MIDITKATQAFFEHKIDYCVVKVPRFAFEKFQGTDDTLTTRMKAVGEVMAIGRTFEEALSKAMRSLENSRFGLGADGKAQSGISLEDMTDMVARPTPERIYYAAEALRAGMSTDEVAHITKIDPFFVVKINDIVQIQIALDGIALADIDNETILVTCKHET